jgi:hypothetical protein
MAHLSSDGDTLYYPNSQGGLATINLSTGRKGWSLTNQFDPPAIPSGDRIFVRSGNQLLHVDKRSGIVLQSKSLPDHIYQMVVLPERVYLLAGDGLAVITRKENAFQNFLSGYSNATIFVTMSQRIGVLNAGKIELFNPVDMVRHATINARGPVEAFVNDENGRITVKDSSGLMSFNGRTGQELWRNTASFGTNVSLSKVADSIIVLENQPGSNTVSAFSAFDGALQWRQTGLFGSRIVLVNSRNSFVTDTGLELTIRGGTNLTARQVWPGPQGSTELLAIGRSVFGLQSSTTNANCLQLVYSGETQPYRLGWYTSQGNMERQGRPELGILEVERCGAELIVEVPTVLGSVLWLERTDTLTNTWTSSIAIRGTGQVERVTLPMTNSSGLFRLRLDRQ